MSFITSFGVVTFFKQKIFLLPLSPFPFTPKFRYGCFYYFSLIKITIFTCRNSCETFKLFYENGVFPSCLLKVPFVIVSKVFEFSLESKFLKQGHRISCPWRRFFLFLFTKSKIYPYFFRGNVCS